MDTSGHGDCKRGRRPPASRFWGCLARANKEKNPAAILGESDGADLRTQQPPDDEGGRYHDTVNLTVRPQKSPTT